MGNRSKGRDLEHQKNEKKSSSNDFTPFLLGTFNRTESALLQDLSSDLQRGTGFSPEKIWPNMDNGMSPVHPKTKYKRAYNIYLPWVNFFREQLGGGVKLFLSKIEEMFELFWREFSYLRGGITRVHI